MSSRRRTGLRAEILAEFVKVLDLQCGRADPRALHHCEDALQVATAES